MTRILITGATGLIGSACVTPLIERGLEVHTVSRRAHRSREGLTVHQGDLLDTRSLPDLLRRISPNHLLHVAWDVTHGTYWHSRNNLSWIASSCSLLQAFLDAGGTRAVGVGTCAEYDWTRNSYRENDLTLLNPSTSYGRSKLAVCHAFAAAGMLGASTAWGRLFFPYGPGESHARLLPSVINGILRKQPVPISAGTQVRDFMYVDDVGAALAALVVSPVTGPVNIASGRGRTLSEMVDEVTRQIGGAELIQRGAIPPRAGDPACIVGRVDRLSQEVGFRSQVDLTEGITRTIAYWREQLTG